MSYNISVVIPFFNEKDNIKKMASDLNNYFSKLERISVEIIFVDDGSTDGSLEILEALNHKAYDVRIIKLSRNFGSHAALRAGVLNSNGEYVTFMYVDLQDPLDLIERLYKKSREGYDIVFACRNKVRVGFTKRFFSKLYAILIRLFVCKNFPENGFDIVMFNTKVKNELNSRIEANSSLFLQILTLGFRQASIIYDKGARLAGKSKWTFSKNIKLVIDSFVSFSYVPMRLVSLTGIVLSLLGFVWMFYIIIRALIFHNFAQGWSALASIFLIGFGVTNISLGIIAEYLWRTFDVSRNTQAFIIDKIIECKGKDKKI